MLLVVRLKRLGISNKINERFEIIEVISRLGENLFFIYNSYKYMYKEAVLENTDPAKQFF